MSCRPEPIVEKINVCISKCSKCNRFGLHYNNLMIGYEEEHFKIFCEKFLAINFDKHSIMFPDLQERILINTSSKDIQINLKRYEFKELQEALQETQLILSARKLIKAS